jgi:hypothetical protein
VNTRQTRPGIGHNSIQYKPSSVKSATSAGGRATLNEELWRQAERHMVRRERMRLMKRGIIRPAYMMPPQLMVKNADGSWSPEIKVCSI